MELEQFKSIFDNYYKPIKNFLYYKLGDVDMAEDITQEVFMKAWDKRNDIILETVKSYLYTIAHNLAVNYFKSAKKRFEFKLNEQDRITSESPHYIMESAEFGKQLNNAIASLSEPQRTAFLMNRMDDLTYVEIAERLEISVKAVEKRMHGALEILRVVVKNKF